MLCLCFSGWIRYIIRQSMSRKGNCYDNTCMESFFSTLKKDIIYGRKFNTRETAKILIIKYIETFYNCRRLHSSLVNMSPIEYEKKYYDQKKVAWYLFMNKMKKKYTSLCLIYWEHFSGGYLDSSNFPKQCY